MKDSEGNELHVGDQVYFKKNYLKKWLLGEVQSIKTLPSGDEEVFVRNEANQGLITTNRRLLKKVQQTVDPHATVTMISLHDGNKEG